MAVLWKLTCFCQFVHKTGHFYGQEQSKMCILTCYPFIKTFSYICKVSRLCRLILHICESVFRKSFSENVVVFLSEGWHGTTLTSCRYMKIGAFCTLILHIYYGVGYCVVYFRLGLTTTFKKINESQLHTFFVYTHLGARWQFSELCATQ